MKSKWGYCPTKLQDFADVCIMGKTNLPPTIQTKVISKIQQLNKAISLLVSTKLLSDMFDSFTDFNPLSPISRQIQILQTDPHTFPYCAFHKHANSKVQKALSQLRFWLLAIIITITSNEPWNTERHIKTHRNPPITNYKPWPFEPVKVKFCFLRGPLRWLTAAKNAIVSWLLNFRICMFVKSAVMNWLREYVCISKLFPSGDFFLLILTTFCLDYVLILLGENWLWSLLVLKRVKAFFPAVLMDFC